MHNFVYARYENMQMYIPVDKKTHRTQHRHPTFLKILPSLKTQPNTYPTHKTIQNVEDQTVSRRVPPGNGP